MIRPLIIIGLSLVAIGLVPTETFSDEDNRRPVGRGEWEIPSIVLPSNRVVLRLMGYRVVEEDYKSKFKPVRARIYQVRDGACNNYTWRDGVVYLCSLSGRHWGACELSRKMK